MEKMSYVVLKESGANKIAVVKIIREIIGLDLIAAKRAVDNPGVINKAMPKAQAEAALAMLKEVGATAELQ